MTMEEDYKKWPAPLRKAMIGLRKASGCGANANGGGGFQKGNTCASGGGKKEGIKTVEVIHTSPAEITEIHNNGRFDDVLFFSNQEYAMGSIGAVYSLELDESKVVSGYDLDPDNPAEKKAGAELVAISGGLLSEDEAFELLSGDEDEYGLLGGRGGEEPRMGGYEIGELGYEIQRLQGRIAAESGFDAFESEDEQGTVYIVPMTGKLQRLKRVR